MNVRALTPLFRWIETRSAPAVELDVPSAIPGSHGGEMVCLALGAFFLTAAAAVPATADVPAGLRWPLVALLLFTVPQIAMLALSLLSAWLPAPRREPVHDWMCLAAMTAWAAWLSPGAGWTAAVGRAWLLFAALNIAFLLLAALRRRQP